MPSLVIYLFIFGFTPTIDIEPNFIGNPIICD